MEAEMMLPDDALSERPVIGVLAEAYSKEPTHSEHLLPEGL